MYQKNGKKAAMFISKNGISKTEDMFIIFADL